MFLFVRYVENENLFVNIGKSIRNLADFLWSHQLAILILHTVRPWRESGSLRRVGHILTGTL
jgi:hypothetical protein